MHKQIIRRVAQDRCKYHWITNIEERLGSNEYTFPKGTHSTCVQCKYMSNLLNHCSSEKYQEVLDLLNE